MRTVGYRGPGPRIVPTTESFLRLDDYQDLMMRFVPCTGVHGLYEASTYTLSYRFRHHDCLPVLGAFRWRGMQEHLETVLEHVADTSKLVVDLGGAGCPLGLGSIVIDKLKRDATGQPVRYSSVSEVGQPIDTLFSSHCLEHIYELDDALQEMQRSLKPDGVLLVFVPSYSNEGWRFGAHDNKRFGSHQWTFGLNSDGLSLGLQRYLDIDVVLARYFSVECAQYCGDDSIFCVCRRS